MTDQTNFDQSKSTTEVISVEADKVYYSINLEALPDLLRSKLGPVNTGPGFNDADLRSWLEYSMGDFDEESREKMQEILNFVIDAERLVILDGVVADMDRNLGVWPPLLELNTRDTREMMISITDHFKHYPDPSDLKIMVESVMRLRKSGIPDSITMTEDFDDMLIDTSEAAYEVLLHAQSMLVNLSNGVRRVMLKATDDINALKKNLSHELDIHSGDVTEGPEES
jgi:hypothetical protein